MNNKLLGVVLCGGKSRRMGSDKGLLMKDGKAWAVIVADKITELGLSVVISVNPTQQESYEKIFPDTPLIVDNLEIEGPLEGLLTVYKNFPDRDILLLACDLIDIDTNTLEILLKTYQHEPGYDFYAYKHESFSQTFGAIYTSQGLTEIYTKFRQKQLKKYSLHNRFDEGKTKYIDLNNPAAFTNYNSLPKE